MRTDLLDNRDPGGFGGGYAAQGGYRTGPGIGFAPRFVIAIALVVGLAVVIMLAVVMMFPGTSYQTSRAATASSTSSYLAPACYPFSSCGSGTGLLASPTQ
ncbi:hypothetical protein [Nocardia sp. NPDC057227]|uniref:hypothetical protein n=1 Tax=Nocardia sp. NPDC057227 TaxID=3346056 RepID=UPI00363D8B79